MTLLPSAVSDVGSRPGWPSFKRVVVFRALQLGDMLCAIPALRALRHACPHARITLVGLPWTRDLHPRFGAYLDDVISFPGFPGLPEQPARVARIPAFLREVMRRRFDLALQLHGNGRLTNSIVASFGAARCAGCRETTAAYCPGEPAWFPLRPTRGTEIERLLAVLSALGIPGAGTHLEFPLSAEDHAEWRVSADAAGLVPGRYVCVHPGARRANKRWAPDAFAAVADACSSMGLDVVLTGTRAEAPLTAAVARAMHTRAVDLAGPMSLGALGAAIRDARLLICNDTGVSHLAAAVNTPSVVVFLDADLERWAPLDRARHRVVYDPATCRGQERVTDACSCPGGVTPAAVLGEATRLLAEEHANAA
ncbi:MAG TPA: glycosyltransferase family 9 protein [Gemmatimonadaceae bacterium]|nr:glycosyltransferase family 9 protein [Gemmatimonadaceae bacterium]